VEVEDYSGYACHGGQILLVHGCRDWGFADGQKVRGSLFVGFEMKGCRSMQVAQDFEFRFIRFSFETSLERPG
jgi:hypothetical protein